MKYILIIIAALAICSCTEQDPIPSDTRAGDTPNAIVIQIDTTWAGEIDYEF